jgi:hypothetical protein
MTLIIVPRSSRMNAEEKTKNVNIFNESKYARWYLSLMELALSRDITTIDGEFHHIVPKSIGGSTTVKLTFREHFIAHMILRKAVSNPLHRQKMELAFFCLCNGFDKSKNRIKPNSYWFERARFESSQIKSEIQKGRVFSDETRLKMSESQKRSYANGRNALQKLNTNPRSKQHRENISKSRNGKPAAWTLKENAGDIGRKISQSLTGKIRTEAHRINLSNSLRGIPSANKGIPMSETQKEKLRKPKSEEHKKNLRKPKIRACCFFCQKEVSVGNLRFHLSC